MAATPFIPLEKDGGIYLPGPDLWLDAPRGKPHCVVTHAHSDHVAAHQEVLCSPGTSALLKSRYRHKSSHRVLPFFVPAEINGHLVELLPAGHILGSAMVHVTRLDDGATLLYTGDFKLEPGLTSEVAVTKPADLVIMECTFGLPKYEFPPLATIQQNILDWCRKTLAEGLCPVLLGYSLGKAQELLGIFRDTGLPIAIHRTIAPMCRTYEELGVSLPPHKVLASNCRKKIVIIPPNCIRSKEMETLPGKRSAMASGWAMDPRAKYQAKVDEVFPLSDHAGYSDLIRFVELTRPKQVLTTHGFCREFARDLRLRGWDAWSLAGVDQMDLRLVFDA
jgi:DNA ligase-1